MTSPSEGIGPSFPSCLLSDCDGVIVDSEVLADAIMLEVLQETFRHDGLEVQLAGMLGHRVVDIIECLETRLGVPLGVERRRLIQEDIDARVAWQASAMPGVKAAYESLRIPVGIVSNSSPARLQACVRRAGLAGLVGPGLFSGDEVRRPKPAPDVYLWAARAMNAAPSDCLVIEDSVVGVLAARAAGMPVLGFMGGAHIRTGHGEALRQAGAYLLFDDMKQLSHLVEQLSTEGFAACRHSSPQP